MKPIHKITSAVLALSFLVAYNFCAVQCAFASEADQSSAQCHENSGHHQKPQDHDRHSGSEKHDAGSTCCSSLVAVKNASSDSFFAKVLNHPLLSVAAPEKITFGPDTYFKPKDEFPPGASPPSIFLLTHFSHAPPASL